MSEVTQILERISTGNDPQAQEEMLKAVYNELHIIAQAKMANERPGHTLQATILANDVWLKLFPNGKSQKFENRAHFFGTAAIVMHRILVDHARRRLAKKRGVNPHKTLLSDTQFAELAHTAPDEVIEAVDEALEKFTKIDKETAKLVELRFFAGLSMQEAADVLGISKSSAERDYAYFSAWFRREFGSGING